MKPILCQNKSKCLPKSNSFAGLYTLSCSYNAENVGKAKKKESEQLMTTTIEHQPGRTKGK